MTPKEKRERLFRKTRPNLRAFEIYQGNEYHRDLKLLWVAHQQKSIELIGDVSQEQFAHYVEEMSSQYDLVMVDDPKEIGIIRLGDDGWLYEPHVIFFPWATKRQILRVCVGFFQWARCSRKIGCIEVRCGYESKNLFDHVCTYGVLHYVGKIINGSPKGDTFIYSVKGKKNVS